MALLTGDEVIEIAMHLEESGEAFYSSVAGKATTPGVKALFKELAEQEQYHRRAFQHMRQGTVALVLSPEEQDEFQAYTDVLLQDSLFARPEGGLSRALAAHDERAALQSALEFENETILFFAKLQAVVRGPGQQTVERVIREERQHIQRLAGMLAEF
jgi:rubrerythrin